MANSETFSAFYNLGNMPPDGSTTYPSGNVAPTTVDDDRDGNMDMQTAVGDSLTVNGSPGLLYGFSDNGDPIVFFVGSYYVLSNNTSLTGNVNPTTMGTYTYCFGQGTRIATPSGEVDVEALSTGDEVLTTAGEAVPVLWLGHQTLGKLFSGLKMQPVRIQAGALGNGLPHSDLVVTADHGMIIDGYIINASALVNGTTIDWIPLDELPDRVTYYHVETEKHDVILANGAAAETFIDCAGRQAFDNYSEYVDLYGLERIVPELAMPRISAKRLLPDPIKARLGLVDSLIGSYAKLSA